jgi:hypothetical protein
MNAGRRPRAAILVAGVFSIVTGGVALWSVKQTWSAMRDPCTFWEAAVGHRTGIAAAQERCRSVTVREESKARALIMSALVPGGLLIGIAAAVAGVAASSRRWVSIAAAVMFAETFVVLTIFPLTLATGLAFAGLARAIGSRQRASG